MPWKIVKKGGCIYVQDKDGKLKPKGGYPDDDSGHAQAVAYLKALYANSPEGKE